MGGRVTEAYARYALSLHRCTLYMFTQTMVQRQIELIEGSLGNQMGPQNAHPSWCL